MRSVATTTFVVPARYEPALRTIRDALRRAELLTLFELDLSAKIYKDFGIEVPACRVLLIDSPVLTLEAVATGFTAATMLPFHVTISERGSGTMVQFTSSDEIQSSGLPISVKRPISKLQARLSEALDAIAMREALTA